MSLMENSKRAYDEAANAERINSILNAAQTMVLEEGFKNFSLSDLSKRAGLAKGVVYMFVETPEELFAELYLVALEKYLSMVMPHAAMDTALTAEMLHAAKEVPLFLKLLARFTTTIEPQLTHEGLIETKRSVGSQMERFAARLVKTRGLEHSAAMELAQALFVALQGASHLAAERPDKFDDLPEDVKASYALSDFDDAFARTARMILRGAS
jgi:AcrR family transcriptional regulator